MSSLNMRQLVKSMVNWNIYNDNILTRVFARLENSRSSLIEDTVNPKKVVVVCCSSVFSLVRIDCDLE